MKIFCRTCTIHFVDEFEKTISAPCNYWGDIGMANLPVVLKRKMWDWLFSMPADEIGLTSDLGISFDMVANPIPHGSRFENIIPGYNEMSEPERKAAQKEYFKNTLHPNPHQTVPEKINKSKERTVN